MRREYDLKTDVLDTIVATTRVTPKHAALVAALAARTEYRGARFVKTRDEFSEMPARIIDVNGAEVAADYHAWIDTQLGLHGGSAHAVCAAFKDSGYQLVETQSLLHYFIYDRGGDQNNFVQIEVWEDQDLVEREVLPRDLSWGEPSADELRRGSLGMGVATRLERRHLGEPRYRLSAIIDMQRFVTIADAAHSARRQREGDRQLLERNSTTGEQRLIRVRDLMPNYDQQQWRGRRLFDDWADSSPGRAGERICHRWVFSTSDYTDPRGVRMLDFVQSWTHTRKIAGFKNTHRLDVYSLYNKLTQFDERIGYSFAWYFYGLHGNLVKDGQMQRVLEAVESGLLVLPEHDHRVLRRWADDPYGF